MKTQGVQLPYNIIRVSKKGKVEYHEVKSKINKEVIKRISKFAQLTPAMVGQLKEYEGRIDKNDVKTLEKIRTILNKPVIKDPILDFDVKLPYQIAKDKVAEEQKKIAEELENK
jgi:hypothetical protein